MKPPTPLQHLSRRHFLILPAAAGALAGLMAQARANTLLKQTDAEALAMDYLEDASQVPPGKFAQYKVGQTCANCALYLGTKGAASGGCSLFMDKDVAAIGWCSAWESVAKASAVDRTPGQPGRQADIEHGHSQTLQPASHV